MIDWTSAPTFGQPDATLPQHARLSAYALVFNSAGELAVVQTPHGCYLPGGGALQDESSAATIRREVAEETGLEVALGTWIRTAIQHAPAPAEGASFEKRSIFHDAVVVSATNGASEPDHATSWIDPAKAVAVLTPESHRWAVAQWCADQALAPDSRLVATPLLDADNPVVQLCAAGMAVDGDAAAAHALFVEAWASRRDDYDACIAAHFLARHQPTPLETLHWNRVAAEHADAVTDGRARPFLASLYLNLADSLLALGAADDAAVALKRGIAGLEYLPPGGYRDFVAHGLQRLQAVSRLLSNAAPVERP